MKHRRSDRRTWKGRTLDCSLAGDPRNEDFLMSEYLVAGSDLPVHTRIWRCPVALDQGREGACVGFAGAHFFGSESRVQRISRRIALLFYKGAQRNDRWTGEDYEGTTINGLMLYLLKMKLVSEFRWLKTAAEVYRTISFYGPVILGAPWREGCFEPDAEGYIKYTGADRGGHAVCVNGVDVERSRVIIQQSWGRSHGVGGVVYMTFTEFEKLMAENPRAVFPCKRSLEGYARKHRPWWQRIFSRDES
jgi:hypothetical protein